MQALWVTAAMNILLKVLETALSQNTITAAGKDVLDACKNSREKSLIVPKRVRKPRTS